MWYFARVEHEWLSQARRGVIELCVLSLISHQPRYGYQLASALADLGKPLAASEGTLYPLLRRLQRDGFVDATWQESPDGPPRKYYHLSEGGKTLLAVQLAEWEALTRAVDNLRLEVRPTSPSVARVAVGRTSSDSLT